jgi:hypothetical protein
MGFGCIMSYSRMPVYDGSCGTALFRVTCKILQKWGHYMSRMRVVPSNSIDYHVLCIIQHLGLEIQGHLSMGHLTLPG